ncbi:MAG TPA: hypothetical protein VFT12_06560 [Thermoanaerobaculia bacterium]|nr:hypothetical protein [Thermoanaerobaculia bacterium]
MASRLSWWLLLVAISAQGQTNPVPPWLWSDEDRIQERFNPRSIHERRDAEHARPRRETDTRFTLPDHRMVIDGRRNPELLMPWEVMNVLLAQLDVPPGEFEVARTTLRDAIARAGWDPERFWRDLEVVAAEYIAARRALAEARGRYGLPEGRLVKHVCAARAKALTEARTVFGKIAFDEFLYTAIAPNMHITARGTATPRR